MNEIGGRREIRRPLLDRSTSSRRRRGTKTLPDDKQEVLQGRIDSIKLFSL
jgi:hypothetical protein